MSDSLDRYGRVSLGGATNVADGSKLSDVQIEKVLDYLRSPGSGPNSALSFAEYVDKSLELNSAALPAGVDYVGRLKLHVQHLANFDIGCCDENV